MTVTVTDFLQSQRCEHKYDQVIGMLDRAEKFSHLALKLAEIPNRSMFWFDDVNDENWGWSPKEADIASIIQLIKDKGLDDGAQKVLVHCAAGISRSTAVAIGLLIMRGSSIPMAWELIQRQRPMMWPNELILKHFDKLLDLKGELVAFDKKWKADQMKNDRLGISAFAALFDSGEETT